MKNTAIFVVMLAASVVSMKLEESPPEPSEPGVLGAQLPSQILAGLERKPSQISTGRCVEYGINYADHDIDTIYDIHHWSDCSKLCYDYRSCSYWTWNFETNACWLKTLDARREKGYEISGSYDCLSEC